MPATIHHLRPQKPKRLKGFTLKASGATFQQLTRHLGTGMHAERAQSVAPFTGPNAAAMKAKYARYDPLAQAWIARAWREPWVQRKFKPAHGSGAELVVVGRFLDHGFVMHRTVFYQEVALRGFRLDRVFVSDVAIARAGTLILLPIDGHFFHARTLQQQLDAQKRNAALSRLGRVVVIPDTETLSGARLDAYLRRKGVA